MLLPNVRSLVVIGLVLVILFVSIQLLEYSTWSREYTSETRVDNVVSIPSDSVSITSDSEKKPRLVFAYCKFRQKHRKDYGHREVQWLAEQLAGPMRRHYDVELQPCAPDEGILGKTTAVEKLSMEKKRELLGLNADIRMCYFGTTSIVKTLMEMHPGAAIQTRKIPKEYRNFETGDGFLKWPERSYTFVGYENGTRVGPFMIRKSYEPWLQAAKGVELQLETKRNSREVTKVSIPIYQPFIVSSNPMRMRPLPGEPRHIWTNSHGCCLGEDNSLLHVATRTGFFDARAERRRKHMFASFLQSHCHGVRLSTGVRHAFLYLLAKHTGETVSPVGRCPKGDNATALLGLTKSERSALSSKFSGKSSTEVHSYFRFAVVFENSFENGYITEKLLDGYLAKSVPIYFGADEETVKRHLNPKAFVFCKAPSELINEHSVEKMSKELCPDSQERKSPECLWKLDMHLMDVLEPHFLPCIERVKELEKDNRKYEAMLEQPLLPAGGQLSGIWNMTHLAELILFVYRHVVHNSGEYAFDVSSFASDYNSSLAH